MHARTTVCGHSSDTCSHINCTIMYIGKQHSLRIWPQPSPTCSKVCWGMQKGVYMCLYIAKESNSSDTVDTGSVFVRSGGLDTLYVCGLCTCACVCVRVTCVCVCVKSASYTYLYVTIPCRSDLFVRDLAAVVQAGARSRAEGCRAGCSHALDQCR